MRRHVAILITMAVLAVQVSICPAIGVRHDRPISDYNALANQFPAAGYLGERGFGQSCSASLVAPNKVLTAAHCVDLFPLNGVPDVPIGDYSFGTQSNVPGILNYNVSSVAIHPEWSSSGGATRADLAVLTLSSPITNITPASISADDPTGLMGYAVGYGLQGTGLNSPSNLPGANDKLAVENIIDFATNNSVEFDFDHPNSNANSYGSATPLNLEGGTASGDSGSPLFAQFPSGQKVVGVLNSGFNPHGQDFEYGDISIYAPIARPANLNWLATQGVVPADDSLVCDFDGDGVCDITDIDMLYAQLGSSNATFDLNSSGVVDNDDVTRWLSEASDADPSGRTFVRGDANLDGSVGGGDFSILASNFAQNGTWGDGNFVVEATPGGGQVLGNDFSILAANFGFTSVAALETPYRDGTIPSLRTNSVPEPGTFGIFATGLLVAVANRRRR